MIFKEGVHNGRVILDSGDTLSVCYTDPRGTVHIFNITAQHLVMMVSHEETESAMICRPSSKLEFVPGNKM